MICDVVCLAYSRMDMTINKTFYPKETVNVVSLFMLKNKISRGVSTAHFLLASLGVEINPRFYRGRKK